MAEVIKLMTPPKFEVVGQWNGIDVSKSIEQPVALVRFFEPPEPDQKTLLANSMALD